MEAGLRHGGGPLSALDYSGSKNSADGKVFWNPEGTELADPFLKGQTGLTRFSAPVGSVSSAAVVTAPSVSEPSSSRHPHLPWQGGGREGRPGLLLCRCVHTSCRRSLGKGRRSPVLPRSGLYRPPAVTSAACEGRGVSGSPSQAAFLPRRGSVPATLLSTCARGTSLPPATCFSYPEASQIRGTDVKG